MMAKIEKKVTSLAEGILISNDFFKNRAKKRRNGLRILLMLGPTLRTLDAHSTLPASAKLSSRFEVCWLFLRLVLTETHGDE